MKKNKKEALNLETSKSNGLKSLICFVFQNTNCVDKLLLVLGFVFCIISSALYPSAVWLYGKIVNLLVNYSIEQHNNK
jgi:hypothetical protein